MMYPKIGIRPTIDGRWGGIREGLEEQTLGMAQAARKLIETLKYPDGTPVQVAVSPCTIGQYWLGAIGMPQMVKYLFSWSSVLVVPARRALTTAAPTFVRSWLPPA